jgi:hypothetical protein
MFAAIEFAPLIRETVLFAGRVMANVLLASPATVNDAATPAAGGTRAGPTAVLELSVPRTTVPAVPVTAIVPKSMSLTLVSVSGPTIVAVAIVCSVSVDCANTPAEKAISIIENVRIFFIFSVFKVSIGLFFRFAPCKLSGQHFPQTETLTKDCNLRTVKLIFTVCGNGVKMRIYQQREGVINIVQKVLLPSQQ